MSPLEGVKALRIQCSGVQPLHWPNEKTEPGRVRDLPKVTQGQSVPGLGPVLLILSHRLESVPGLCVSPPGRWRFPTHAQGDPTPGEWTRDLGLLAESRVSHAAQMGDRQAPGTRNVRLAGPSRRLVLVPPLLEPKETCSW